MAFARSFTLSDIWNLTGASMSPFGESVCFSLAMTGTIHSFSRLLSKVDIRPSVLGVLLFQPGDEFLVVLIALVAAVRQSVVTQIELLSIPAGQIRGRAVGSESTEDRNVPHVQDQFHRAGRVHRIGGQFVIFPVLRRHASARVIAGEHLGAAVVFG